MPLNDKYGAGAQIPDNYDTLASTSRSQLHELHACYGNWLACKEML
jgi:hypothetical protein